MKISIITPIYNEEEALRPLFGKLNNIMKEFGYEFEILAIDDGSSDESLEVLKKIGDQNKNVKVLSFNINYGQTAAISAGFDYATGEVIIPIDSDLENDPSDIPKLIDKLKEGYDVVSGWRKDRWKNKWLTRKIPSKMANWFISKLTGIRLHDYGCTLKAYRKEALENVRLYGELHRFIPAFAVQDQSDIAEVEVNFIPREHGESNYGPMRIFKVLLDLLLIRFLDKYMSRPIHFFGALGFSSFGLGIVSGMMAVAFKLLDMKDFVETPLPVFTTLFITVGVLLIAIGLLAEIVVRTYYESQNKKPYSIAKKINF